MAARGGGGGHVEASIWPIHYLIRRLERVQIAAASFVLNRYATMYLGWLPVTYNMELNFCKTVFKALDNEDWPPYLRLELREPAEFKLNLAVPEHSGAFQDSTTRLSTTPPPPQGHQNLHGESHLRTQMQRALSIPFQI